MDSKVLTADQEKLFSLSLDKMQIEHSGRPAILPRKGSGPCALSFAQQRLWFLEQLEPNTATYNIPSALRLCGNLNTTALQESLNELVRRHESLRTTFALRDDVPAQIIAPELQLNIAVSNLEALPTAEREVQASRFMNEEAHRPFDLTRGPLLRVTIMRLFDQEHILLINMHHIISDAWSMGVLVREWAAMYAACCAQQPPSLKPLSIQYPDFAEWQIEWLQFGVLEELMFYWQENLKGAPPLLELLTDRPRSAAQSSRGANVPFHLDRELSEGLTRLGHGCGATLFMVLLAAFKALLHRYTGQIDIVVGTPIANRHHEELEPLIGLFVNTLVLRTDMVGDPTFRELIGRIRETALGAYAHQDMPLERLVEQLGPVRRWGKAPFFQVMFALQNAPVPALALPGLTLIPLSLEGRSAKFDLTLHLQEEPSGLSGELEYATDLFEEATVKRMLAHYQLLLEGAVKEPDARLSELPLLRDAEYEQLVYGWNDTGGLVVAPSTIHALFEDQVARTPDLVAVVDERQELSYSELNARSNKLAHYLIGLGVEPESRVGICMHRGVSMVVGVMGILKAGAAYLPLEPAYPPERLSFMLADGEVGILLTELDLVDRFPKHESRAVLMDRDWPAIAGCSAALPHQKVTWENLAYVIYTSGSTGWPKGVMIEHRNCVAFIKWAHTLFGTEDLRDVFASTSLSFDLSVFELFAPLTCGGKITLVQNALELTEQQHVSLINTVPSAIAELVRSNLLPSEVRTISVAGEPFSLGLARSIRQKAPNARILNLYGPSEDTTYSTFYELPRDVNRAPWIGMPISNSQVYVLDDSQQPTPIGVPGQIHLGGAGLARGYVARPDLTAERFVPNPFSLEPGKRLYRTGDRGRIQPDGNLEYLGRGDEQVKVRGYRIEPGEIEVALSEHEGVHCAVVVAREDNPGDKRLVAYIEPQPENTLMAGALRDALKKRLPEFMVPSAFVFMTALPRTATGKIDRRALPAPEKARSELTAVSVPARDAVEAQLVAIWEKLFDYGPIGITESFFEIGGHSLLALRLQGEVRNKFNVEFPLAVLFEHPTIEHLAEIVRLQSANIVSAAPAVTHAKPAKQSNANSTTRGLMQQLRSTFGLRQSPASSSAVTDSLHAPVDTLIPIQTAGSYPPFFCVHPIGGNVLCYAELAHQLGPEQPFYGLQARKESGLSSEDESIEGIASRYIQAIRTAQPEGPYRLGGWSLGGIIAYEMAQQLRNVGQQVAVLVLLDSFPFAEEGDRTVDEKKLFASFVADLAAVSGVPEAEQPLVLKEQLDLMLEPLKKANILPQDIGLPQFNQIWQQYRANFRAFIKYEPLKYAGKITLIMAADPHSGEPQAPIKTWAPLAGGGLSIDVLSGDHYSLLKHPMVRLTADKLGAFLESTRPHGVTIQAH